ncbi:MAG: AAA family ATPase [Candidatus Pacebacteria bacterium]|nr:AAA family ATPase [Candidatus Paceibacterota bacterium]
MYLKSLELIGFKSFGKKSVLEFSTPITAIVGPNGSGKSNTAEAFRFVLGEQSFKSMRGKKGEDLIWGGSSEVPRSNRASVKAVFDNSRRLLNVDFDEVVFERVVYRDGTNEYLVNGSKVRLKDVTELLAGANVGASGHHIISQGEADRVLAATPRERRQMIEDALGLRIYQYKKDESLKKLEKTEENKVQVESLRRENAPHLKFLERQIKKLEKARELRAELVTAYHEYLRREEDHLSGEREAIAGAREEPKKHLREIEQRIVHIRHTLEDAKRGDKESEELLALERQLSTLRNELANHTRSAGRIEGQHTFESRRLKEEERRVGEEEGQPVPYKEARTFWEELTRILDHAHGTNGEQLATLTAVVRDAQHILRAFVERHVVRSERYVPDTRELERLEHERGQIESAIAVVSESLVQVQTRVQELSNALEAGKDKNRDLERELFSCMSEQTEVRAMLGRIDAREATLRREEDEFKREISEAIALIGRQVMGYKEYRVEHALDLDATEDDVRTAQYERRRALEKQKIRLEEMGGASADDITKEYQEVKERDEFLEKELADLTNSALSLRNLIADLDRELSDKFTQGVTAIGTQFSAYFTLMFGGGSAKLLVTSTKKRKSVVGELMDELMGNASEEDTDEDGALTEEGVEVEVSLPKKRIQNLMMLSGGERTLTSIALIFAMSQVNPPPFIILDETDAALDEANSKRYGDMIATLAQKSQLILITHNRETMGRAGVLYGITMGMDGVSRILSVKFDDAVAVAK